MSVVQLHGEVSSPVNIIPDSYKLENLQSLLGSMGASSETEFRHDTWFFPNEKKSQILYFGFLKDEQPPEFKEVSLLFDDGSVLNVDFVTLIKILFLSETSISGGGDARRKIYRGLIVMSNYLFNEGFTTLKLNVRGNLHNYLTYQILCRVRRDDKEGRMVFSKGYTPVSHSTLKYMYSTNHQSTLNELGLSEYLWGNTSASKALIDRELKSVLNDITGNDISLADYKQGESFNYLTLDYGRYYVDHCASYFRENYVKAMALNDISQKIGTFGSTLGYVDTSSTENSDAVRQGVSAVQREGHVLNGTLNASAKTLNYDNAKLSKLKKIINTAYAKRYRFHYAEVEITKPESIDIIAKELKLVNALHAEDEIEHIKDRLKVIVQSVTSAKTRSYRQSLLKSSDFKVSFEDFDDVIKALKSKFKKECIVSYFATTDLDKQLDKHNQCFEYKRYIYATFTAGFVHALGLLGWRQSELGFPLDSIEISENDDKLDQYFHPLRYKINWIAKKTSKETLLEREITQDSFHLICQLKGLASTENNKTCLISRIKNQPTPVISNNSTVHPQTKFMWEHFVEKYKPFKRDDEREKYKELEAKCASGTVLSHQELERLKYFAAEFPPEEESEFFDGNLTEVKLRVRGELSRVILADKLDYAMIRLYKFGGLSSSDRELIEEYVPDEMLETVTNDSDTDRHLTKEVCNAIRANCIYPTPHAFRHMWAESVYRRFDGDAGWMIRSHFKHISQSMWLAYIRNKDNQIIHSMVKKNVISTLLKNFVKHGGDNYSGKIIPFLNKSLDNTHMLRADGTFDLDAIDDFALSHIVDIKTSPWGYCLLQRLDQAKANCAIDGVPQRFNASPSLCLGCSNFFTQSTNVNGILLSIAGDIKALHTPMPMVFKQASKATVTEAYKHLKNLGAPESKLNIVENALNAAVTQEDVS